MKKMISLSLAAILAMGLMAGCGSGSKPASGEEGSKAEAAADGGASAGAAQDLVMGTGSTGGTYFALGGAMANAINNKLSDQKINITAQSTGASVENLNLIQAGEMDLGIAMNNVAAAAQEGTGAFSSPLTNVKAIGVV